MPSFQRIFYFGGASMAHCQKKPKKKKKGAGLVRHPKINMKQNKYPQLYTEGVE
jgi:hypothetical protein